MAVSTSRTVRRSPWACTSPHANGVACQWTLAKTELLPTTSGESIYSPMFYTGNGEQQWKLAFFPRGKSSQYCACFLHLQASLASAIHVRCEISIWKSGVMIAEEGLEYTYDQPCAYGINHLVKQSKIFTADCSEITIKVYCFTDAVGPTERLIENLQQAFEDPQFSDFTIIVGGNRFPVHKMILSARSSMFASMFQHEGMIENQKNEVVIEDLEAPVVRGMLEYLYTGRVTNLDQLADRLLAAAEKYDLAILKAECGKSLCKTMTVENAAKHLGLGHLYGVEKLKDAAFTFMLNNIGAVIQTDGYKDITDAALLKEIIERSSSHWRQVQ